MAEHKFGPGTFVLHRGRAGLVVSKHGRTCPWYLVEFHQSMPMPHGPPMEAEWADQGCHRRRPEWHYEVSLEPLPPDWQGAVPASLLRRIRGSTVHDIWLKGYCFGRKEGFLAGKLAKGKVWSARIRNLLKEL